MTTTILRSFDREVSVGELRAMVSAFSLHSGLHCATVVSSRFIAGTFAEFEPYANSFNLPLLAKAILLWGNLDGGRTMAADDLLKVLKAINSLPWYSRLAAEFDTDNSVLSMIIRQGFQRYYTDDPLDARIARTWMMFHELVKEDAVEVPDPSGELRKVIGLSAEDLWTVGMMVWAYYSTTTARNGQKWVFDPQTFVLEGNNQAEMQRLVAAVVGTTALTPTEFRQRYTADKSKYRDASGRDGYWISEFNILRDFPIVKLTDGRCVAPFPTYALTRALDGFYYDLLNAYAEKKRADSGGKGNAFDNVMSQAMGTLFERYIGRHLQQLPVQGQELRGEFAYRHKKQNKDSTDWILNRARRRPVLFECKAREAVLDVQRYANMDALRDEIRKAIGKACGQMARFIKAIDENTPGLEQYHGQDKFICAVVLQAPLPFHMVRDIRALIESVATEMEPDWAALRKRIAFVPMSARELETAVATELKLGVPIEDQLMAYADYRERVDRLDRWENEMPVFARHLEEFLQEQYGGAKRIVNDLCHRTWLAFTEFCQRRIFGESIDVADRELFELTQRIAFDLWEKREKPLGDDQHDWYAAEEIVLQRAGLIG